MEPDGSIRCLEVQTAGTFETVEVATFAPVAPGSGAVVTAACPEGFPLSGGGFYTPAAYESFSYVTGVNWYNDGTWRNGVCDVY